MAFQKARTALAQLEEKLRRQLGLAGEIGSRFEPILTPVIIAADLREAGNASNTGRAFSYTHNAISGASGYFSVQPQADVRIDRIWIGNSVNCQVTCWLSVPGQSPAVAVTTLSGTWVDRKTVATDQVPLTAGVFGALTGTNQSDQNRILCGNVFAQSTYTWETNIMLPATSALNFLISASGQAQIGFSGRIWP